MNYSELVQNVSDTCENTFETTAINNIIKQAEQTILNNVQPPVMRNTDTTALTASQRTQAVPTGFLWPYSFAITNGTTKTYLINKDVSFLYEAYPDTTSTGVPKYYAIDDSGDLVLGPTPDSNYATELIYAKYPESIVAATNTWLGDNYDMVLFNACMVEAARFLKLEQDVVAMYDKMYAQALGLMKNSVAGKLRQDVYRSGEYRQAVS